MATAGWWRRSGCSCCPCFWAVSEGAKPKLARLLAERQAAEALPDPEIRLLLRDRVSLVASAASAAAAFVVLVLMVWRPD